MLAMKFVQSRTNCELAVELGSVVKMQQYWDDRSGFCVGSFFSFDLSHFFTNTLAVKDHAAGCIVVYVFIVLV